MIYADAPYAAAPYAEGSLAAIPAEYLSGARSAAEPHGAAAAVWTAVVILDGVDVGGQVVGPIVVEADEGAARIADLTLRPPAGTVLDLPAWTGKSLTIDLADASTGLVRYPMRLFTGLVDTPDLDLAARVVRLRATDDLQGVIDGLTRAELATLIGGRWSPAIFDGSAVGWRYAQDRLSTVRASLDAFPDGGLRLTSWQPAATPDLVFDQDRLLDESVAIGLADRQGLVNTVAIAFGYRFPRLKAEGFGLVYQYVDMIGFAQYVLDGKWFLQRAAVESAISSAGLSIISITYTAMPTSPVAVGTGFWTPNPAVDATLCRGFTATVAYDYAQDIEEAHQITVVCAGSVAAVGAQRQTLSGALEGVYQRPPDWETKARLYRASIETVPPQDMAPVVAGKTTGHDPTLTAESDRAAATAAIETLIDIAKTSIWASHRRNSVSGSVCLNPALDVDKTVEVIAAGVHAIGKVRRVRHRMDPETGEAVSEFELALCAVSGVGVTHPETTTEAAPAPGPGQADLTTAPVITFNNAAAADHAFTIAFPAVDGAERDKAAPVITSSFDAPLVEDVFTVTL